MNNKVMPALNALERSRLLTVESTNNNIQQSYFAGYLLRKFASRVLLITSKRDIQYIGEEFAQQLRLPSSIINLNSLGEDNYIASVLEEGLQTVLLSKEACLMEGIQIMEKTNELVDLKFEAVSVRNDQVFLVEVEVLPQVLTPPVPTLSEHKLHRIQGELDFMDAFVMGASHDLNGSLLVFKAFLDLIHRYDNEDKKLEILHHMQQSSDRMERILKGLSELVEYQKGYSKKMRQLEFLDIFYHVQLQLEVLILEAKPQLHIDFDEAPSIHFHQAYLSSILYNLLSNSLKYRREEVPAEVWIKTKRQDDFVVIVFRDNGIGMDMKLCQKLLFRPFQRFCPEREGTGIGLSFIHKIITAHGGSIEVESYPNQGTTFTIHLPIIAQ